MQYAGIICEYNPFHSGHAAHIEKTRALLGEDTGVICVMSGNFVQRGEPAIMEKHARAKAAIEGGADLVIELPSIWSVATAERFSLAGVHLLSSMGLPITLSFGSECGDIETLNKVVLCLSSEEADELIVKKLKSGVSYAAARQLAASELLGDDAEILRKPNNILGIEYLKAIRKLNAIHLTPMTFGRVSTEHDGAEMDGLAPASAIRNMILNGEDASRFMPEECEKIYYREAKLGRAPIDYAAFQQFALFRLRTMPEEFYKLLPDTSEGLWNRLMDAGKTAQSYPAILEAAKTKRYAMSRIRRMVLCALLGITSDMQQGLPPYIRPLAFNKRGRAILHDIKETATLPIITKPASAKKLSDCSRCVFEKEVLCTDIYSLLYSNEKYRWGGQEWVIDPVYYV